MDLPESGHDPVQLNEVLQYLAPTPGKTILDCTTGRGGHSLAIASHLGPTGQLLCLDADPRNLEFAKKRMEEGRARPSIVRFFHGNFSDLPDVLEQAQITKVDGILADLGISTNQLFDDQYGMSFAQSMPLDMRINPDGKSAADIVNHAAERDLADILFHNAQERHSFKIARKIAEARRVRPITTTGELADIVRQALPRGGTSAEKIDPATRTFLALRMEVNEEMRNLQALLDAAPNSLNPGGRLVVISFQSMEDRLVKQSFRAAEQTGTLTVLTKKPLSPSEEEIERNPRARSAKLRAAEKTSSK